VVRWALIWKIFEISETGCLGEDAYVAISSKGKSKKLGRDTELSQVAEGSLKGTWRSGTVT
jgi:hypothetical protein